MLRGENRSGAYAATQLLDRFLGPGGCLGRRAWRLSERLAKVPASDRLDCNESVKMSALPLRDTSAAPTLAEAMEPLRLFTLDALETPYDDGLVEALDASRRISLEHLEAAEGFLQARADSSEALATIQATILLCEGAGEISEAALEQVSVDDHAFPRAAAAVEWTRGVLRGPRTAWPEGFWPRFLLGVLAGEHPAS